MDQIIMQHIRIWIILLGRGQVDAVIRTMEDFCRVDPTSETHG